MKKRLLSALLALALVFVLLPTTALAGETTGKDYDISINGKGYKFDSDGSNGYITAYYYGNSPSNYFFSTEADHQWATNSNLKLTKEDNTVTITIRPKKKHISGNAIEFTLEKKSTTSGNPYDYTPCIEMGNNNNLVITGKGTLNITRDEKNGIGAALCSEVGDITITDGITVKANFLKQVSNSTVGNAISVKDHNLIISGKNTKVEARNSSCNFQDLYYVSATVCVENGEIKVSDGATLSAINNFTNSYTSQYSYYSRAISGSSSKPCALTVTGENSCVIAETDNSLGKAYGYVNFSIDGAKIEVGTSSPAQTITDINNIKNYKYAKISVPALQRTSDVFIAGEQAIVGQKTSLGEGKGYYTYNKDTKTLTLEDATISSGTNAIQFKAAGTYTVNLEGTNTISNVSRGILAKSANQNITGNINVILSGSGSLDISAKGRAIEVPSGNLTFNNTGAINLKTTNTAVGDMNAIKVSGEISIGSDFNKNLKITTDNGDFMLGVSDLKSLNECKTITIAPKPSETYYNNTAMKYGETRDAGSGTISCDENGVITLNGATEGTLEFRSSADSTLVLKGTSTLSSIVTTQKGLTISGSGSLTVGSIKVTNNDNIRADLTITGGAHVTVNRPSGEDEPAVEVSGNLTVTGDGTQLSAECTAATNPAIEVGGNVTISGNPGTNSYTVKAYNKYAIQRGRDDKLRPSQMPTAFEISGNLSISGSAQVMAQTDSDGAAVWMPKEKVISVVDASLIAQNRSHNFSTISFGDESNMGNIYAKGQVNIVAENMLHSNSSLAHKAIKAYIYNLYSTGDSNPYYINVVSEGVHSGGNVNVIPGHCTSTGDYKVTITRGDEVARTQSPVVIAGTTLLNDTYYTITSGSTVDEGTESNYNAFYNSTTKTLKLNNASINGAGTNKAIEANVGGNTLTIELVGNNIVKTSDFANNVIDIYGNLYFTGSGTAEISGKGTPIYATYKIDVSADVTITNTEKAGSFTFSPYGENYKGANTFAIGAGYTAYATTDKTTWAVYDNTTASENESYTTLRITTQPPETGGGSTHQHTYDQSAWKSDATHHWQECTDPNCPDPTKGITNKASHSFSNGACTVCGYRGQTEEHHFGTEWFSNAEYHWHKCTDEGCDAISGKAPHEWTGWRIDEPSPGMHNRFCNCGYNDYSHHYNLVYAAAGEAGHYQYCTLGNCTFKTSTVPHNYDGDTCTICNYTKSGEIVPPTPDNPGTIVIIRPAEEEKPAQQPNPSTGANDLVGLAVAAAVAAALGSAALLRKHD